MSLGSGRYVVNVYASFNDTGDRVLNCIQGAISTNAAGGFYQSASNPFWAPSSTQNSFSSDDSWVTIGTNPNGNGNAFGGTAGDSNFLNFNDSSGTTTYDFSVIEGSGNGAGWFNPAPTNNSYGLADTGKVLVAHLVIGNTGSSTWISWNVAAIIQLANGQTVTQGAGPHVWYLPSPGALCLLGVAGMNPLRRRRT
ncbi:MAG: hypothetical protein U0636_07205 [Phycisphaerales bacterium]